MREAHRNFRSEIIKLTTNLGTLVENIRWTFRLAHKQLPVSSFCPILE